MINADAAYDAEGGTVAGHNMLKYWLRPLARQGLDEGEQRAPLELGKEL